MKRVSLSGLEKSLAAIWEWYEYQSALSLSAKSHIRQQILAGDPVVHPTFFGMSLDDVDAFFGELDWVTILDLVAAAEAAIRVDFLNRAYHGNGERISKIFRGLYKQYGPSVRLDEDILEAWKAHDPAIKNAVGDFKGVLKMRHWLAHGRYWTPKFGMAYSPADVFAIASNLLLAMA